MVTIRTYANPVDAALAKSVLDDHDVPSVLIHENANTFYSLAMPVRLLVPDDQANRAIHILTAHHDEEEENETETETTRIDTTEEGAASEERANRNPWELLALAFYLLLPAICLLARKFPAASSSSRIRYLIARAHVTQFLSFIAVVFALLLIVAYFRLRQSWRQSISHAER